MRRNLLFHEIHMEISYKYLYNGIEEVRDAGNSGQERSVILPEIPSSSG
jgi:hypothetical protein